MSIKHEDLWNGVFVEPFGLELFIILMIKTEEKLE